MISSEMIASFKKQYSQIHPLIFHRSLERAKSPGDLFDILDKFWIDMQNKKDIFPVIWHDEHHCWEKTDDLFQSLSFVAKYKERK